MLRAQVGKSAYRLLLAHCLLPFCRSIFDAIQVEFLVSSIVCTLHETTILLIALQHCHAKILTIGSHLGDVFSDKRNLNDQIDLAWSLKSYRAIRLPVFLGDSRLRKGGVFELNINLAMNRADGGQPVNL